MIEVTGAAHEAIEKARKESQDPLRIEVTGGSSKDGFTYRLGFDDEAPQEKDIVQNFDGFKIVMDSRTHVFLNGMTLDYISGVNGRGFIFQKTKE